MPEYIEREAVRNALYEADAITMKGVAILNQFPAGDVAPVVRCQNCIHAEPLDRNCELNTCVYMHCKLGRGEEEKNVWHKYKKYYKDYSLVDRDGFCDAGERMDGELYESYRVR